MCCTIAKLLYMAACIVRYGAPSGILWRTWGTIGSVVYCVCVCGGSFVKFVNGLKARNLFFGSSVFADREEFFGCYQYHCT